MRELFAYNWDQEDLLISKYAEAERRGEVQRKQNKNNISPEAYARRLLADARKNRWIPGYR